MLDIVKAMKLSDRLQFIYENLSPAMPVWDFCCDHGYLGVEALKSEKFTWVAFVDQVPHIVRDIELVVREKFPQHIARARFIAEKGEDLREVVTGNIVIAGVGAYAIFKILGALESQGRLHADRLLLCPQRDDEKFLAILNNLGKAFVARFSLSRARTIEERGRFRTVYVFNLKTQMAHN